MTFKIKRYLIRLDPEFKKVFKEKKDPYATLASKIFNVSYVECNPFEHYDNKKYKQCKSPTAQGQLYRNFAKLLVLAAVYPKRIDLKDTIKNAHRILVINGG